MSKEINISKLSRLDILKKLLLPFNIIPEYEDLFLETYGLFEVSGDKSTAWFIPRSDVKKSFQEDCLHSFSVRTLFEKDALSSQHRSSATGFDKAIKLWVPEHIHLAIVLLGRGSGKIIIKKENTQTLDLNSVDSQVLLKNLKKEDPKLIYIRFGSDVRISQSGGMILVGVTGYFDNPYFTTIDHRPNGAILFRINDEGVYEPRQVFEIENRKDNDIWFSLVTNALGFFH